MKIYSIQFLILTQVIGSEGHLIYPDSTVVTEDGNINSDMMQVGNKIPLTDKHGNKHMGIIKVIMKDAVTMDFNHPLAGIELRFVGSVTDVIE